MSMGIVSDDDFLKELNNNGSKDSESSIGGIVVERSERGRSVGDNNVPESLRKIIGEESVINGRQEALALAKMFGVSDSSVSAYAKGATSTASYNKPSKGIQEYIKNRKAKLTKKALFKLAGALDSITDKELSEIKTRDKAAIAKDMSAIVKNLEPSKDSPIGDQQNNQFIFYAPNFMNEQQYDVVQVQE
jgi:hypothetical protein